LGNLKLAEGLLRGSIPQRALERLRSEALAEKSNRKNFRLASGISDDFRRFYIPGSVLSQTA